MSVSVSTDRREVERRVCVRFSGEIDPHERELHFISAVGIEESELHSIGLGRDRIEDDAQLGLAVDPPPFECVLRAAGIVAIVVFYGGWHPDGVAERGWKELVVRATERLEPSDDAEPGGRPIDGARQGFVSDVVHGSSFQAHLPVTSFAALFIPDVDSGGRVHELTATCLVEGGTSIIPGIQECMPN